MDTAAGYKTTEIGIIPEDWELVSVNEAFDLSTSTIEVGQFHQQDYVSTENLLQDKRGVAPYAATVQYSSVKEYKKNDILVSNIRPYLKKIWQADKNGGCSSDVIVFRTKGNTIHPKFAFLQLADDRFFRHANDTAIGTKMPRGDKNAIREYKFAVPKNLQEQERISSVVCDFDKYGATVEEEISKKKLITEGTMQQLLSGRTRLPGFVGPWEIRKMSDIIIENGTTLTSSSYQPGHIPVIAGGKSPAGYHHIANRKANTITISASGAYAGYVALHDCPIFASDCSTISEQAGYDVRYLYYSLLLKQSDIYQCQTGGAQPHVHAKDIKDIPFSVPCDVKEQQAIAALLSDMDAEIKALEAERDKYALIRQGVIQKLLTGQIRLI